MSEKLEIVKRKSYILSQFKTSDGEEHLVLVDMTESTLEPLSIDDFRGHIYELPDIDDIPSLNMKNLVEDDEDVLL